MTPPIDPRRNAPNNTPLADGNLLSSVTGPGASDNSHGAPAGGIATSGTGVPSGMPRNR